MFVSRLPTQADEGLISFKVTTTSTASWRNKDLAPANVLLIKIVVGRPRCGLLFPGFFFIAFPIEFFLTRGV